MSYSQRQNYLTEADAGVSTHKAHIETTFAFRTRILDYLWAGLPMVVTEGDTFAELVEAEGLGIVVPAQDVAALEAAIERVLFDEEFAAAAAAQVARVREDHYWERVLAPLVEFVRNPKHAADYTGDRSYRFGRGATARKHHGLRHDLSMAVHHLRISGLSDVVRRIRYRLSR